MLDNLTVIPEGTPEAIASVANNLINKEASACGWLVTPKWKWADKEKAVNCLIKEIEENKNLNSLDKAACISNARKIIKEYCNQNDIVQIAIDNLTKDAKPEKLDDDWLNFFMDKAKNISNEDVQIMFGKLLAEECNKQGTVSKQLIHILTIMNKKNADSFKKLCTYKCEIINQKEESLIVVPDINYASKYGIDLQFSDFFELANVGLISYSSNFYEKLSPKAVYGIEEKQLDLVYGEKIIHIMNPNLYELIPIGNITLTNSGNELATIIMEKKDYKYFSKLVEYFNDFKCTGIDIKVEEI